MRITDRVDILAAIVTVVIAVLLLMAFLRLNQSIGLSVTLLVSAMSYILLSLYRPARAVARGKPGLLDRLADRTILKLSVLFTLIMLSAMAVVLYLINGAGSRPLWFFIVLPLFATLVFAEVFVLSGRLQSKMLELSVFVNVLIIIGAAVFSFLIVYPDLGFSGGGDQIFHKYSIGQILSSHFIDGTNAYQFFPVMHTFVSMGAILTGIADYNTLAIAFIAIPYLLSLLIIYGIYTRLTGKATALIATLFTGLSLWFIYWGIYIVPYTFSFILFSLLVFVLLLKKGRAEILLAVLCCAAVLFTHSMTSIAMVFIAIILYALARAPVTRHKISVSDRQFVTMFAIFSVILVTGYLSVTGHFFSSQFLPVVKSMTSLFQGGASSLATASTAKPMLVYELDNINAYLLYFFAGLFVFGRLKDWRSLRMYDAFAIALFSLFTAITYVSYGIGLQSIIPYRWLFFSSLIIGYPVASGLFAALGKLGGPRRQLALFMAVVFLIIFTTIASTTINTDTPLYGQSTPNKYSLSASDLRAVTFQIQKMTPDFAMATYGNPYIPYKNPINNSGSYYVLTAGEYRNIDGIYENGHLDVFMHNP